MQPIKVGWALVNYGPIYSPVYSSHLRAIAKASRTFEVEQLGAVGACGATDRMYTHSGENRVVEEMLRYDDITHIFMTESDMILPDDTLTMLAALDKDLASGLYFIRGGGGQPCLYKRVINVSGNPYGQSPVSMFPDNRPFKLNGCCGVGCLLIKRQVFETLKFPWFDLKEDHYGSDLYFHKHVRDAGFEVWVHPLVRCEQIEYKVWGIEDYYDRIERDPEFRSRGAIIGADID